MFELCSLLCLKLYSLNFAIAHAQKRLLCLSEFVILVLYYYTRKLFYHLKQAQKSISNLSNYFTDRSKAVLLLWIFCSVLWLLCLCARLFICALWSPAGKGLTSWLSFVVSSVSLSLSHWYPGSGVVLDCIDS